MRLSVAVVCLLAAAPALARPGGTIAIDSTVAEASVEIDGKVVGKTPLKPQAVSTGTHIVKVRKLGFLEYSESVVVGAGKTASVFADLLPFAGVLVVRDAPKGAVVSVDGKEIGKAPLEHELKIGKHTVVISAPGYTALERQVVSEPGQTHLIEAKLQKAGGDELDLEPLALAPLTPAPPAKAPQGKAPPPQDDPLALEPVPVAPAKKKSGGDELDLEPLSDLALIKPPPAKPAPGQPAATTITAAPAGGAAAPPVAGLTTTVEPAKPWYLSYWVWGAAAAVVAGGVVLGVVLSGGDEVAQPKKAERTWEIGVPVAALH